MLKGQRVYANGVKGIIVDSGYDTDCFWMIVWESYPERVFRHRSLDGIRFID